MTSQPPRPETIQKLDAAVYPSFAMLAGMQLDLFTPLKDGPMNVEGTSPRSWSGFNKTGTFTLLLGGSRVANHGRPTVFQYPRVRPLSSPWQTHLSGRKAREFFLPLERNPQDRGVHQGRSSSDKLMDFHDMTPEQEQALYRGGHPPTLADGRMLPTRYDFSAYRSLLDLGGGSGGLAIGVTEECPHIQATVGELPEVVAITRRFIQEAPTSDRLSVMEADFLGGSMNGTFDAVVMRNIIQVLSQEQARNALKNVIQVVEPGGNLYILGRVLDDSHLSPLNGLYGNLFFLNIYDGGQAYTEQLHRDWMTEAGFESIERTVHPNGRSTIVARKPS